MSERTHAGCAGRSGWPAPGSLSGQRARIHQPLAGAVLKGDVLLNGTLAQAAGRRADVTGDPHPAPLKAIAEEIPLDVVYETRLAW